MMRENLNPYVWQIKLHCYFFIHRFIVTWKPSMILIIGSLQINLKIAIYFPWKCDCDWYSEQIQIMMINKFACLYYSASTKKKMNLNDDERKSKFKRGTNKLILFRSSSGMSIKLFWLPIVWLWAYLMKGIPETNRLTLSVSDEGYSRNQSFDFERIWWRVF